MKFTAAVCTGLLVSASCAFSEEAELGEDAFTIDFGDTIQYIVDNVVALDDAWSPDNLPEEKSHLDYTFFGHSPPVYPSRKFPTKLHSPGVQLTI